jgi:hypothetical protein
LTASVDRWFITLPLGRLYGLDLRLSTLDLLAAFELFIAAALRAGVLALL